MLVVAELLLAMNAPLRIGGVVATTAGGVEESPGAFILRLGDGRASDGPMAGVGRHGIIRAC